MKVIVGSMIAGNNSPVLTNDLSQINDELLKIGAIDIMRNYITVILDKMNVNRVLVFKSIDALKKENLNNKPGNFTTKFIPKLILEDNKKYFLALDHLSMTASWYNIRPEYNNNKLKISKNGGTSWVTITFPKGIYDYDDINKFIHGKIGKLSGKETYRIDILFDLTTYKVLVKLDENYQIDFKNSGNFGVLLGFDKKVLKSSSYGTKFSNISNSIDNLYIRTSLLSNSIISGKRSNVLYTFSTNTKTRSLPFEIQPHNYLWNKINNKVISEVTFYITDDEDREVDLNDIDISLTVVLREE